jgi:hypothetical protein
MSALGDDIIRFSKGEVIRNEELMALYDYRPEPTTGPPQIAKVSIPFRPSSFKKPYLTYQFEKSYDQRTWYPEHIFTNRQIHAVYHRYRSLGYGMVDIGHRIYNLRTAADIINGSEGHIGVCSGMGWFAVACGKSPDIWYATRAGNRQIEAYAQWWTINGARIHCFDSSFQLVDCDIAADGKKYCFVGE